MLNSTVIILVSGFIVLSLFALFAWFKTDRLTNLAEHDHIKIDLLTQALEQIKNQLLTHEHHLEKHYHQLQLKLADTQVDHLKNIQTSLHSGMQDIRSQITMTLGQHSQLLNEKVAELTQRTHQKLTEISGQVEKRLTEGFDKTSEVFTKIVERLTIIDAAQQKITELSTNVVSLQEILADKRSRGAFGEVQLNGLIYNMLPEESFCLQSTLSNGKRVDCLLKLPKPTGNIAIDAKFPLENYRLWQNEPTTSPERKTLEQQFKQDIRKHIKDIAEKYIIEGETSDGAIMFIPSESIFADLHAYHSDVIDFAYRQRVWLVSPTTMMAILTTARAVLKDVATRKQVHIIQEHLRALSEDFLRFQKRMDLLAKHIELANKDVGDVQTSARKITSRFNKIEQVELSEEPSTIVPLLED